MQFKIARYLLVYIYFPFIVSKRQSSEHLGAAIQYPFTQDEYTDQRKKWEWISTYDFQICTHTSYSFYVSSHVFIDKWVYVGSPISMLRCVLVCPNGRILSDWIRSVMNTLYCDVTSLLSGHYWMVFPARALDSLAHLVDSSSLSLSSSCCCCCCCFACTRFYFSASFYYHCSIYLAFTLDLKKEMETFVPAGIALIIFCYIALVDVLSG